jgi:hypothetical protein
LFTLNITDPSIAGVVIFGQKRSFWSKWPKTLSTEMLFGGQDWLFWIILITVLSNF